MDCHFLLQGIFVTQGSNIISWVSWMASRFFIADFLKWNSCYTTTLAIRPLTSHSLKTKEHSNNGELFDPKSWVKNISAPTESEWEDTRTKNQLHFSLMENLKIPGKLIFNCTPTHPHTHTHTHTFQVWLTSRFSIPVLILLVWIQSIISLCLKVV